MNDLQGLKSDDELERLVNRNNKLGEGGARCVYAVLDRPHLVITESKGLFHSSNFVEWTVWCALKKMADDIMGNERNLELQNLFASCFAISHSARFLVMERLGELDNADVLVPSKYPDWLNDKKRSAFGKTEEGQIKVLDYGSVDFYRALNPKNKN
jgi:hypothetical protein